MVIIQCLVINWKADVGEGDGLIDIHDYEFVWRKWSVIGCTYGETQGKGEDR